MRTRRPTIRSVGRTRGQIGAPSAARRPGRRGERSVRDVGRPRAHNGIACATCGAEIVGCAVTKYDGGWVHVATNRERCGRGDEVARPE